MLHGGVPGLSPVFTSFGHGPEGVYGSHFFSLPRFSKIWGTSWLPNDP